MANEVCSQGDNKISVGTVGGVPLCVECYYKLIVAHTILARNAAIGANFAAEQLDSATASIIGARGIINTPQMQVPDLPKAPIIMNNIHVNDSVVGSINTGNVHTVDVNITILEQSGNKKIAEALQKLTQAIVDEHALEASAKGDLLEQIAYLSEQASAAAKDRRPGMIKATLEAIKTGATLATSVKTVWDAVEPIIGQFFS